MSTPRFKTAHVKFKNPKYNYSTSVNGKLTDEEVIAYFKGKAFNLGTPTRDNLQICVDCIVEPSNL